MAQQGLLTWWLAWAVVVVALIAAETSAEGVDEMSEVVVTPISELAPLRVSPIMGRVEVAVDDKPAPQKAQVAEPLKDKTRSVPLLDTPKMMTVLKHVLKLSAKQTELLQPELDKMKEPVIVYGRRKHGVESQLMDVKGHRHAAMMSSVKQFISGLTEKLELSDEQQERAADMDKFGKTAYQDFVLDSSSGKTALQPEVFMKERSDIGERRGRGGMETPRRDDGRGRGRGRGGMETPRRDDGSDEGRREQSRGRDEGRREQPRGKGKGQRARSRGRGKPSVIKSDRAEDAEKKEAKMVKKAAAMKEKKNAAKEKKQLRSLKIAKATPKGKRSLKKEEKREAKKEARSIKNAKKQVKLQEKQDKKKKILDLKTTKDMKNAKAGISNTTGPMDHLDMTQKNSDMTKGENETEHNQVNRTSHLKAEDNIVFDDTTQTAIQSINIAHKLTQKASDKLKEHRDTSKKILTELSKRVNAAITKGKCGALKGMGNLLGEMLKPDVSKMQKIVPHLSKVESVADFDPLKAALRSDEEQMFDAFWKIHGPGVKDTYKDEIEDDVRREIAIKETHAALTHQRLKPRIAGPSSIPSDPGAETLVAKLAEKSGEKKGEEKEEKKLKKKFNQQLEKEKEKMTKKEGKEIEKDVKKQVTKAKKNAKKKKGADDKKLKKMVKKLEQKKEKKLEQKFEKKAEKIVEKKAMAKAIKMAKEKQEAAADSSSSTLKQEEAELASLKQEVKSKAEPEADNNGDDDGDDDEDDDEDDN